MKRASYILIFILTIVFFGACHQVKVVGEYSNENLRILLLKNDKFILTISDGFYVSWHSYGDVEYCDEQITKLINARGILEPDLLYVYENENDTSSIYIYDKNDRRIIRENLRIVLNDADPYLQGQEIVSVESITIRDTYAGVKIKYFVEDTINNRYDIICNIDYDSIEIIRGNFVYFNELEIDSNFIMNSTSLHEIENWIGIDLQDKLVASEVTYRINLNHLFFLSKETQEMLKKGK